MSRESEKDDSPSLLGPILGLLGGVAIGVGIYSFFNSCSKDKETDKGNNEKIEKNEYPALEVDEDSKEYQSFLCPITYEIMRDPVITPYGISYDREAIEKWLDTHSNDPLSKKPLHKKDLIPNLALKNSIRAYIERNRNTNNK